jgi:hypothetical protein
MSSKLRRTWAFPSGPDSADGSPFRMLDAEHCQHLRGAVALRGDRPSAGRTAIEENAAIRGGSVLLVLCRLVAP